MLLCDYTVPNLTKKKCCTGTGHLKKNKTSMFYMIHRTYKVHFCKLRNYLNTHTHHLSPQDPRQECSL